MKKIILFILLGFLVANAQPGQSRYQGRTGYQQSIIWNDLHKSLQDSIRNIIADSANANIINFLEDSLSASNGIVYSGRDFRQKIVKDTTTLKAYKPDSSATTIYLKQLSSANTYGGGQFVYKSSGSALKGVRFAATGGGIWERIELASSSNVVPEWFGAIPDDANDDYAAVRSAYDVALTLDGDVIFKAGVYRMSATLVISPEGSNYQTGVRRPYLKGEGKLRSVLYFYNNTDGIWFNGGLSQGGWLTYPGIMDLEIRGNDAAGTSGVIFDSTGTEVLERNWIRNWHYGLRLIQCNNLYAGSNRIQDNVYGVYATTSPNEMTFISNYITNNSNKGFYQNSGNGTFITGGQIAHNDTAVHLVTATGFHLKNVPMEGAGYYGIYAENSSTLTVDGVIVTYMTSTNPNGNLALWLQNSTAQLNLFGHAGVGSDTSIYLVGTNATVYASPTQANMKTILKPTTVEWRIALSNMRIFSDGSFNPAIATEANWGKYFKYHNRSTTLGEIPFYVAKMNSDDYFAAPILNGTDQRVSLNAPTSQPAIDTWPLRYTHGTVNFEFPIDTDSIKNFVVTIDTNGIGSLITGGGIVDYATIADTTSAFENKVWISRAVGDSITFCVSWAGNATLPPDGVGHIFRWWVVTRPTRWNP